MTLPRSRNRRKQRGRETRSSTAAAAALPPSRRARTARQEEEESGWPAPWMPWAVGIGLVLAGALFGYLSLYILARPVLDRTPATAGSGPAASLANAAEVLGQEPAVTAAPGDEVELTWTVKNAGQTGWSANKYRFDPAQDQDTPAFFLPRDIKPSEVVTVHARVTVPETTGIWRPAWDMIGAHGKVEGGRLTAQISVTDEGEEP